MSVPFASSPLGMAADANPNLRARFLSGSYSVRLEAWKTRPCLGERLCIQMAAQSDLSGPVAPFRPSGGVSGAPCSASRGDRGAAQINDNIVVLSAAHLHNSKLRTSRQPQFLAIANPVRIVRSQCIGEICGCRDQKRRTHTEWRPQVEVERAIRGAPSGTRITLPLETGPHLEGEDMRRNLYRCTRCRT